MSVRLARGTSALDLVLYLRAADEQGARRRDVLAVLTERYALPFDDERARLGAARRSDLTTFHVVGRQRMQIAQQRRRVDQFALRILLRNKNRAGEKYAKYDSCFTLHLASFRH